MPIDHVKLPISDLDVSGAFYIAALAPLGYRLVHKGEETLAFMIGDDLEDEEPFALQLGSAPNVRTHVAFRGPYDTVIVTLSRRTSHRYGNGVGESLGPPPMLE